MKPASWEDVGVEPVVVELLEPLCHHYMYKIRLHTRIIATGEEISVVVRLHRNDDLPLHGSDYLQASQFQRDLILTMKDHLLYKLGVR